MAVSARSNRSLSRFWGIVLAVMFYGFVMAGLLGFPGHGPGKLEPSPAGGRLAQTDISATPSQVAARRSPNAQAAPTAIAAEPVPAGNGETTPAPGIPHPDSHASATAAAVTPAATAANAQPNSSPTPPVTTAPSPEGATAQVAAATIAGEPVPAANAQTTQVPGVPHADNDASAATVAVVTSAATAANVQPTSSSTPPLVSAAPAPQTATLASAAMPGSPALSHPAWANIRHRCGDGRWTWQSGACPSHPRPVVWRRVLRGCAMRVGNLCLGPSYGYVEAAAPHAWSTNPSQRDTWR